MGIKITLEAKPLEYQVEVPGYGLFTVRKMGAGAEADVARRLREMDERSKQFDEEYKDIIDQEKELAAAQDEGGLKKLKGSKKYQEAVRVQKDSAQFLRQITEELMQIQLGLWDCEDKGALKRFLNDFTSEQIQSFYKQVMDQAEPKEETK